MDDTIKAITTLREDIKANCEPTQRVGLALQNLSTAQRHLEAERARLAAIVTRPAPKPETRKAGK